jgi:DNA-binding protein H-NS
MDIANLSVEEKIALLQQLKQENIEDEYRKIGKAKLADLLREKQLKLAEIEKTYANDVLSIQKQYGLSLETTAPNAAKPPKTPSSDDKRSGPKPIKFCDPNNISNKWTGQGMMPKWLTPQLEKWGITKEQFIKLSIDDATLLETVRQYHV